MQSCDCCHLAHASDRNAAEGSEHVGLDAGRRFKHKDATGTKQIHWNLKGKHTIRGFLRGIKSSFGNHRRYLGVDLHRQEQPEASMRLHGVELLLQLHQPSRRQVDVLQHHPPAAPNHFWISAHQLPTARPEELHSPAGLHSRVDVFVRFVESLCRTCGTWKQQPFNATAPSLAALQTLVRRSPMEMEVICLFCSVARSLTRPLASYPGTEHMSTGVLGLTCSGGNGSRRVKNRGRSPSPITTYVEWHSTSLSTMLPRSRGCSMMFMKDSPSAFETKMCDMASRRSGRKAWMSSSWCTA